MKKIIYTTTFLLIATLAFAQNVEYGLTVNNNNGLVTAFFRPDFTTNDLDISTAQFVFTLPAGTLTSPGIAPVPGSGLFTNINDEWEIQRITQAECAAQVGCGMLLDDVDVYTARASLPVTSLVTTVGDSIPLFSFQIVNGCDGSGGTIDMIDNNSTFENDLSAAFGANFENSFSAQFDMGVQATLYNGNDASFDMPACPPALIPTMSQWALFLFALIVFTLGVVVVWNVKSAVSKA